MEGFTFTEVNTMDAIWVESKLAWPTERFVDKQVCCASIFFISHCLGNLLKDACILHWNPPSWCMHRTTYLALIPRQQICNCCLCGIVLWHSMSPPLTWKTCVHGCHNQCYVWIDFQTKYIVKKISWTNLHHPNWSRSCLYLHLCHPRCL